MLSIMRCRLPSKSSAHWFKLYIGCVSWDLQTETRRGAYTCRDGDKVAHLASFGVCANRVASPLLVFCDSPCRHVF